jgi:hypothetical protein
VTEQSIAIKGGADEFEAAVIAVVLDHIEAEERAAVSRIAEKSGRLPAWVRVVDPHGGLIPRQPVVIPD